MSRVPSLQRIVSSRLGLQPEPTIVDSLVRHIVSKMNDAMQDFNVQIRDNHLNEHFIPYYLYFDVFVFQVHHDLNELEKNCRSVRNHWKTNTTCIKKQSKFSESKT